MYMSIKIICYHSLDDPIRSFLLKLTLEKTEGLIKNVQYSDTGSIEHKRHRTTTIKTKNNDNTSL